jgi:hypothetical protein
MDFYEQDSIIVAGSAKAQEACRFFVATSRLRQSGGGYVQAAQGAVMKGALILAVAACGGARVQAQAAPELESPGIRRVAPDRARGRGAVGVHFTQCVHCQKAPRFLSNWGVNTNKRVASAFDEVQMPRRQKRFARHSVGISTSDGHTRNSAGARFRTQVVATNCDSGAKERLTPIL